MAKLTSMTIIQSILILEHIFHNYRQFRVTQRFNVRILGNLKANVTAGYAMKMKGWLWASFLK